MGITRQPRARHGNQIWIFQADPILTAPGNGSYQACRIVVPFKHKLLRAIWSAASIEKVNGVSATLKRSTLGATSDGVAVDIMLNAAITAGTDTMMQHEFTIGDVATDKADQAATKGYHMTFVGTDAGDLVKYPMLALLIQPLPRIAL